jgi:LssY C-terminus
MFGLYFRLLWRLVILLLGILLAFGVVDQAFPYLDRYLPSSIVFLVLYVILAYIGIPALIRLWRLVIKPNHIPMYVTTPDGWASDPINIAVIVQSRKQLVKHFKKAGWHVADKATLRNMLREGYAILFKQPYPTAPMSRLMLFNRSQDIGFQLQDGENPSPRHRHHVRFWRVEIASQEHEHHTFWKDLLTFFIRHKSEVWVGAATHDISPVALRIRNLQITHKIDSDTNKERDFLIETLQDTRAIKGHIKEISSGHELAFRGQTFGVNIIVDGKLKVIELKK